ncbi:MAG: 4-hydroxy-tetrahydrodipicolinate synthase [Candidatus Kapaibacteriales bacterium]
MKKGFTGTYTAMVTPYDSELNIDYDAFERLLQMQIDGGVDGVVVCGSTGEAATLASKEKISLFVKAKEYVGDRIKIIAGSGTNDTVASANLTFLAKEQALDGALLVAPYYNKPSQEGLYHHYKTIAENVDLPLILYNVPGRSVVNISSEVQLRLAEECENIVSTKEASGNLEQIMEIIKNAPDGFTVLAGEDSQTPAICYMGGEGVIGVIPNYLPQEFSDCVSYARQGEVNKCNDIFYSLMELMALNFIESNPSPVKYALSAMGKINNNLRLPLMPVQPETEQLFQKALAKVGLV